MKNNKNTKKLGRKLKTKSIKKQKNRNVEFEDNLYYTMRNLGVPVHSCGGVYLGDGMFMGPDGEIFEE